MPVTVSRKELEAKKQEINILYGKLSEVEATLKEETKINSRLRTDVAAKIAELTGVESKIVEGQERYRWRKQELEENMNVISTEGDTLLEQIRVKTAEINVEIAEHDTLQLENDRLHNMLKKLGSSHYEATLKQDEEREHRKQAQFDIRANMEQTFRRTLKEVDYEYKTRAQDKMKAEAEWARQENARLRKEAIQRSDYCEKLVNQQKESYDELIHTKVARDVAEITTHAQEESTEQIQRNLEVTALEVDTLEQTKEYIMSEISQLKETVARKASMEKQLNTLKAQHAKAQELKDRIVSMVNSECTAAIEDGLVVVEKDNARKAKKLAEAFEAKMTASTAKLAAKSGDVMDEEVKDAVAPEVEESKLEESQEEEEEDIVLKPAIDTATASRGALAHKGVDYTDMDPELLWNSSKSDIHKAKYLRQQVRKSREATMRSLMQ
jgi:hypothetical protein